MENIAPLFGGAIGIFIIVFSFFLFVATLLLPFYVYGIYTAARRLEKRMDVLLQHTEMLVRLRDR